MKHLIQIFLTLLIMHLCMSGNARQIFVVADHKVHQVTIADAGCVTLTPTISCIDSAFSIALKNDTLYYNWRDKLYRATRQGNSFTNCSLIGTVPALFNSLTTDESGILYFVRYQTLYKMDPRTGQLNTLGDLPYPAAGDMLFHKGDLYVASTEGILKVNLTTPASSTMAISLPGSDMYGLATTPITCGLNNVYGLNLVGTTTQVVVLNLDNGSMSPPVCSVPYIVNDAASVVESGVSDMIRITGIVVTRDCSSPSDASVRINYQGGSNYIFTLDTRPPSASNQFTNVLPGNHTLRIVSSSGCSKDTFFTVGVVPPPGLLQTVVKQPTCAGPGEVSFIVQPAGGSYSIEYGGNLYPVTQTITTTVPGANKFVLVDNFGCRMDSATVTMTVPTGCGDLYFPNVFTPNKDGLNDTYKPGYKPMKEYRLSIYNRWGQVVFTTQNILNGWNGTYKGELQPNDIYVWFAVYTVNNEEKTQRGTLMLLR